MKNIGFNTPIVSVKLLQKEEQNIEEVCFNTPIVSVKFKGIHKLANLNPNSFNTPIVSVKYFRKCH